MVFVCLVVSVHSEEEGVPGSRKGKHCVRLLSLVIILWPVRQVGWRKEQKDDFSPTGASEKGGLLEEGDTGRHSMVGRGGRAGGTACPYGAGPQRKVNTNNCSVSKYTMTG